MTVVSELLWLLSRVLLWLARTSAVLLRRIPKARRPPASVVCLPGADEDPTTRVAERMAARRQYELVSAAEKLGLGIDWHHRTVRQRPRDECYSLPMLLSKTLLRLALALPLPYGRRWWSEHEPARFYTLLGRPEGADHWQDDAWFAAQRLQGPNPRFLRAARTLADLQQRGFEPARLGLTEDDCATLYFVDYRPPLQGCEPAEGKHLAPCFAVFQEGPEGLMPLAIELDRTDASGDVERALFQPGEGQDWALAKLFFQAADFYIHESVAHFLWTHVVGETWAIATARTLSWRHPIRRLLAPHLVGTIQQNINAAPILIEPGGLFDTAFAGGNCKEELLTWGATEHRFAHLRFPDDVAERGLDRLESMPYRDDGQLLWDAVADYVQGYVADVYPSDEAWAADPEIRSWGQAVADAFGPAGVPVPTDRDSLTDLLTCAVFNPVAHSLVNALQFSNYGYPLAAPVALHAPVPRRGAHADEDAVVRALPSVGGSLEAARATFGFSLNYDRLGQGLLHVVPPELHPHVFRFQDALLAIEDTIMTRNEQRPWPYRAVVPSRIGNSVDA